MEESETPSSKQEVTEDDDVLVNYFLKSSPIFVQLYEFKKKARTRKDIEKYFQKKRDELTNPANTKRQFIHQHLELEEIDQKTNVLLNYTIKTFLELGCGLGGFSQYILKINPNSRGIGLEMPSRPSCLISKSEKRYRYAQADYIEKQPPIKAQYDLVIANGWSSENTQLFFASQLRIATDHLTVGGNLIIRLSKKESEFYASFIQYTEENFEKVHLISTSFVEERSHFFLVCLGLKGKDIVDCAQSIVEDLKSGAQVPAFSNDADWLIDNYGKLLVNKYNPLWESQYASLVKKFGFEEIPEAPAPPPTTTTNVPEGKSFVYKNDLDTNGIVYHHKKEISVTSSGNAQGTAVDFLGRENTKCWTNNNKFSWFCVDFGDKKVIPTNYTLGYGSPGTACVPLYWVLQGSNGITRTAGAYGRTPNDTPVNDKDWRTIAVHNNDSSLLGDWRVHTWKLNCRQAYRYFRVIQTGPNTYSNSGLEDTWSNVLVMSHFEIYGTLLPASANVPAGPVAPPMYYGSPTQPAYVPPPLIRADASVTKELQDILVFFMKAQQNEGKPEKVRVHEIVL